MATLVRKNRYDVALDGQGFILSRNPDEPTMSVKQEQIFYLRYNQGDHNYNDLSKFWYFDQTDWSGGIKDSFGWLDDAKFYYSTNIDPLTILGALQLQPEVSEDATSFLRNILQGMRGDLGGVISDAIGGAQKSGNLDLTVNNLSLGAWTDYVVSTNQNTVGMILYKNSRIWVGTTGVGANDVVKSFSGTSFTDHSSQLGAGSGSPFSWSLWSCRAMAVLGDTLYVGVNGSSKYGIAKTSVTIPAAGSDWTKIIENASSSAIIIDMCGFQGKLYYLFDNGEMRVYDPASSTDTLFYQFKSSNFSTSDMCGGRLLNTDGANLIITVPDSDVWLYDGSTISRIYHIDITKNNIGIEAVGYLRYGSVLSKTRFYWGNLIYDPTAQKFYNWIKPNGDSTSNHFYPLWDGAGDLLWGIDSSDQTRLWQESTSVYKGAADKNFLILSNVDTISGVDKLAWAATVLCAPLLSGQKIKVEYSLDSIITASTSWTLLDTLDYSVDGAISQKDLFFGDNIICRKIWFRIKVEGGASNTPRLFDFIWAYKPWPDRKLDWTFALKCQDEMKRKDGSTEPKSGVWLRNYLRNSWIKKSIVTFEDFDATSDTYLSDNPLSASATSINVSVTDSFPEIGRLLIGTEEISYTGKTKTAFLNCVRGIRGSHAVTHNQGVSVSMAHRVIIDSYSEDLIFANDPQKLEYVVHLELIEV